MSPEYSQPLEQVPEESYNIIQRTTLYLLQNWSLHTCVSLSQKISNSLYSNASVYEHQLLKRQKAVAIHKKWFGIHLYPHLVVRNAGLLWASITQIEATKEKLIGRFSSKRNKFLQE